MEHLKLDSGNLPAIFYTRLIISTPFKQPTSDLPLSYLTVKYLIGVCPTHI
jgi:hypothetical protein